MFHYNDPEFISTLSINEPKQKSLQFKNSVCESCMVSVRCSRSVTFWYGYGSLDPYTWFTAPDPALFASDANKKYVFSTLFHLLLFVGIFTFTLAFKDKKPLRSHLTAEINVFYNFFACWWKDPESDLYR